MVGLGPGPGPGPGHGASRCAARHEVKCRGAGRVVTSERATVTATAAVLLPLESRLGSALVRSVFVLPRHSVRSVHRVFSRSSAADGGGGASRVPGHTCAAVRSAAPPLEDTQRGHPHRNVLGQRRGRGRKPAVQSGVGGAQGQRKLDRHFTRRGRPHAPLPPPPRTSLTYAYLPIAPFVCLKLLTVKLTYIYTYRYPILYHLYKIDR